jgi:hypothetical protein
VIAVTSRVKRAAAMVRGVPARSRRSPANPSAQSCSVPPYCRPQCRRRRALLLFWPAVTWIREQRLAVARHSERTLLLGTVLLASAVSAATGFVLAQYYSIDVLSSLVFPPADCWLDWGMQIGRHCFGDYPWSLSMGMRPNPWEPFPLFLPWKNNQANQNDYVAAGMVPQLLFGLLGRWLHAPRLGLLAYLLVLTIAVLTPAVWAARGARGLERVVVFVALGAAAIPVWTVIDRGNPVGLVTPVALVFLVALLRQRWGVVAIMVVLAALVKPQFVVLAVALFAVRQWRLGALAVGGAVIANLAAYLLWPRHFPETIVQSIHNILGHGSTAESTWVQNQSFAKGLQFFPDMIAIWKGRGTPVFPGFVLVGYVVLVVVVVCILALGRRIPPVITGIALLATASLFPALSWRYYLVFALPVAAVVVRDPDGPPGSGIFDRLGIRGDRHRAVGICVSLAAALSIAHIALSLPYVGQYDTTRFVPTTAGLAPLLWLIACATIIVSYARRPAAGTSAGSSTTVASSEPTLASRRG